jgi:hypothetical protein
MERPVVVAVVVLKKRVSSEALGDGGSVEKQARAYIFIIWGTIGIFLKLLVCFVNEHKEKARAPRTNTKHLNPSPWQCYSFCWRMRHELKKIGEGEGGEGRGGRDGREGGREGGSD